MLSACETGLGRLAAGEGTLGLQRASRLPAPKNVVASLWTIDDEATVALMQLFYHNLWDEKKPPAIALREAQLSLLHHPEQIKSLATRGPNFSKLVDLPERGTVPQARIAQPPPVGGVRDRRSRIPQRNELADRPILLILRYPRG